MADALKATKTSVMDAVGMNLEASDGDQVIHPSL
jgi:hypothetical protein